MSERTYLGWILGVCLGGAVGDAVAVEPEVDGVQLLDEIGVDTIMYLALASLYTSMGASLEDGSERSDPKPPPLTHEELRACVLKVSASDSPDDDWFEHLPGGEEGQQVFRASPPEPWMSVIYQYDVLPALGPERLSRVADLVRTPAARAAHKAAAQVQYGLIVCGSAERGLVDENAQGMFLQALTPEEHRAEAQRLNQDDDYLALWGAVTEGLARVSGQRSDLSTWAVLSMVSHAQGQACRASAGDTEIPLDEQHPCLGGAASRWLAWSGQLPESMPFRSVIMPVETPRDVALVGEIMPPQQLVDDLGAFCASSDRCADVLGPVLDGLDAHCGEVGKHNGAGALACYAAGAARLQIPAVKKTGLGKRLMKTSCKHGYERACVALRP